MLVDSDPQTILIVTDYSAVLPFKSVWDILKVICSLSDVLIFTFRHFEKDVHSAIVPVAGYVIFA